VRVVVIVGLAVAAFGCGDNYGKDAVDAAADGGRAIDASVDGGQCKATDEPCGDPTECCSLACDGVCLDVCPDCCAADGEACVIWTECCNARCLPSGVCGTDECNAVGDACEIDSDCCSLRCTGFTCRDPQ
jgi:hypothetical protein